MPAYRSFQSEASSCCSIIVYAILPIALAVFFLTWLILRRSTRIWIERPPSFGESIIAGISAWLFFLSIVTWFGGIVLMVFHFFSSQDTFYIYVIVFSVLVTGYGADFYFRSRSEFGSRDTQDYIKEAAQFRRSAQSRLDLISLIQQRRRQRIQPVVGTDPGSLRRARLQANLSKEKELEVQLALLREGTSMDISDIWFTQRKVRSSHPFYENVEEMRIEPNRKRLTIFIDFPEFNETHFKDEMVVLRFNRQVYDFLQLMNSETLLKPYSSFIENYFLLCRAKRINKDGTEVFYPFMKAGMLVSELRKLEGSYFNPRKLSEIAAVAFNNGAQV